MKNNQNKLILISATMLAVIFMTSGCEFESAGAESKDPYRQHHFYPAVMMALITMEMETPTLQIQAAIRMVTGSMMTPQENFTFLIVMMV